MYLDYDRSGWDDYTVGESLQIAEAGGDIEVVDITVVRIKRGNDPDSTREDSQNRAVRIWDDTRMDVVFLDTRTTAESLVAVVEDDNLDIMFSENQAKDDDFNFIRVPFTKALSYEWAVIVNALDARSHSKGTSRPFAASSRTP
ncbi:hypothetical protein DJ69_16810 [Halorubrum persicum]|uniref:Uncharacterized protein n=1 Tax=Halorubrum persicum TaxID=1383844 RepID=A0A2G1WET5_9EURY|nr:hypothetical protein [Halorubrum persicum]PHQ37486.1 hypothetical protein DJ69_16810 [Halorubrum persicum]